MGTEDSLACVLLGVAQGTVTWKLGSSMPTMSVCVSGLARRCCGVQGSRLPQLCRSGTCPPAALPTGPSQKQTALCACVTHIYFLNSFVQHFNAYMDCGKLARWLKSKLQLGMWPQAGLLSPRASPITCGSREGVWPSLLGQV